MPLCLISSGYINIVLFYFGIHNFDDIRRLLSIILLCGLFGLALLKMLFLLIDHKEIRKKTIALCIIPSIWMLSFVIAFLKFGIKQEIVNTVINFGIYCIPAFIFAISIAIERTEKTFIKNFKWYALIIAPLMIYYIVHMIIPSEFVYGLNDLGAVCYLVLGYTLMPILVFCILDLFLHKANNNVFIIILILVLWIALIFTGAKGSLICLLAFLVFFTVYFGIKKLNDKTILGLFTIMISILLFLIVIYSPPSAGIYRTNIFVKDFTHKAIQFAQMSEKSENISSQLSKEAKPSEKINVVLKQTPEKASTTTVSKGIESLQNQTKKKEEIQDAKLYHNGWERMFLYQLAITEGNNAPLTGLGPMGYTLKYGFYPHNAIVELIADFGYLVTIVFLVIVLILIVFLYKKGTNDKVIACMFVYIISSMVGAMISGTIYESVTLVFALGYAAAMIAIRKQNRYSGHIKQR